MFAISTLPIQRHLPWPKRGPSSTSTNAESNLERYLILRMSVRPSWFAVLIASVLGPFYGALPETNAADRPDLVTVEKAEPQGSLIADVEKMIQGGADAEVVKAFIQNWRGPFQINADQILHLHELGAPTVLLTTLIRRSSELHSQAKASPPPASTTPSLVTTNYDAAPSIATTPPLVVYPYPSAPLYTYSDWYSSPWVPSSSYRYWGSPYSFSFGYGWPGYRQSYWGYRPWSGHSYYPGRYYGGHSGFRGSGPGWGGRPGGGWSGGPGRGSGFSHGHR